MLIPNNRLEEILGNSNMTQLITEPTHFIPTSATIIDIIATSCLDLIIDAHVTSPSLSNHCDIAVLMTVGKVKGQKINRTIYDYKRADWENLNKNLKEHDWEDIFRKRNIDEQVDEWTETYITLHYINIFIPSKEVTISSSDPPWLMGEIKKMSRERKRAHRKAKKSKKEEHWTTFRKKRNDIKIAIRQAKTDYSRMSREG
jgi:hypothetical protein